MTLTPELAEVIRTGIDSDRMDLHVAIPATVQSSSSSTAVTVELGVRRPIEDENDEITYEEPDVLEDVPVACFGGGDNFIAMKVNPGDTGYVIFCHLPIGQWRAVSGVAYPDYAGWHTPDGAIFIPAKLKDSGLPSLGTNELLIQTGAGAEITIDVSGTVEINGNLKVTT